jgi:hypothetical protein
MKRRKLSLILLSLLVLLFSYIGTFAWWWHNSPRRTFVMKGKQVQAVTFHMTPFRWHTRALWAPAFWFMWHVRGYQPGPAILAGEKSMYDYEK